MKNAVLVDIDTDRKERPIILSKNNPPPQTDAEARAFWEDDVSCLCEALCTLIHVGEHMKWSPSHATLKRCIDHLTQGFADAGYSTETIVGAQPHPQENSAK